MKWKQINIAITEEIYVKWNIFYFRSKFNLKQLLGTWNYHGLCKKNNDVCFLLLNWTRESNFKASRQKLCKIVQAVANNIKLSL